MQDEKEEHTQEGKTKKEKVKVTMGLDLQPDGLTAGLAGHCQVDKKIHSLRKKKK